VLQSAAGHADRGELAAAAELCEERLRAVGDDVEAHHLLGVVRQAQGDSEAAERCFARALYCDPGHASSMVHLALLLERRGDAAGAARLKQRVARRKEPA
jgi:chemotaxis protein methyltransferase WspC